MISAIITRVEKSQHECYYVKKKKGLIVSVFWKDEFRVECPHILSGGVLNIKTAFPWKSGNIAQSNQHLQHLAFISRCTQPSTWYDRGEKKKRERESRNALVSVWLNLLIVRLIIGNTWLFAAAVRRMQMWDVWVASVATCGRRSRVACAARAVGCLCVVAVLLLSSRCVCLCGKSYL